MLFSGSTSSVYEFDKEADGNNDHNTRRRYISRKRMHAAKDYSGAEIMRTLRDEVINRGIPVVDFTAAVEIILDKDGKAAGAVLMNMETKQLLVAQCKDSYSRYRRCRKTPLSGIPDFKSLRCNC